MDEHEAYLAALLELLFRRDHRFEAMRASGLPDQVRAALAAFWARPEHAAVAALALPLAPPDLAAFAASLEVIVERGQAAGGGPWTTAAEASAALAASQPVAAAIVAVQALAAWIGSLGKQLFFQPWTGHHPGWHFFPLVAARRLVGAEALEAARYLAGSAAGFVEAAKGATLDPTLRGVVAEYEGVLAEADRLRDEAIAELAWALHGAAGPGSGSFRHELAAMFWTLGDVDHARLLSAAGRADYAVPYALVHAVVEQSMRTLPDAFLLQHVWLQLKDRGPFDIRQHRLLFASINNLYHGQPLQKIEDQLPVALGRGYARTLIGWLGGRVEPDDKALLYEAMAMVAPLVERGAPSESLQIDALATTIAATGGAPQAAGRSAERWAGMAARSAAILAYADATGLHEPFGHTLDAPFAALPVDTPAALETTLDAIERFRHANLGYWLAIAPPDAHEPLPRGFLDEERALLAELRGARFIRLLPHLPRHYGRYGFNLRDLSAPLPAGATASPGSAMGFDPFDQQAAQRLLLDARERLRALYGTLQATAPRHAAARLEAPSSAADFVAALAAHAG
ncbi:MAG: hypothetical protein ABI699_00595 [Caldimonas sp.]